MNHTFSTETDINNAAQQDFWHSVQQDTFKATDGVSIAFAQALHPANDKAIVISNGRVESYLKYQELMFDLFNQGFDVYAIDHRGQGLSQRLTPDSHQGFVGKFDDYVDDLAQLVQQFVLPKGYQQRHLLAHSMGSAIASLLLHRQPDWFNSAVFSAPMFGIKLPVPKPCIQWLAAKLNKVQLIKNNCYQANYVLGGTKYQPDSYAKNHLSHSENRYQVYRELYDNMPQLQLGSPTNHWLIEAIAAADLCVELSDSITTPRLILQAESEQIVCNKAQDNSLNTYCEKIVIPGAFHEVLIETDERRNLALAATLAFMQSHSTTAAT